MKKVNSCGSLDQGSRDFLMPSTFPSFPFPHFPSRCYRAPDFVHPINDSGNFILRAIGVLTPKML